MDALLEQELLERLRRLEAKVAVLGNEELFEPAEIIFQRVTKLVEAADSRNLGYLLRLTPKAEWKGIFFLQPSRILKKVRSSVSKGSWRELLEAWSEGGQIADERYCQTRFLQMARQHWMMGSIEISEAYNDPYLPRFEESLNEPTPEAITLGEKERARRVQEAARWVREELSVT
jgi:hypothetical protein